MPVVKSHMHDVTNNKRIVVLDSFRALAILSAMLYHYTYKYPIYFPDGSYSPLVNFQYGHLGVQLFFLISGFVIFLSIQNIKSTKEFYYKRFVRLFPTYWFCMVLTFTVTKIYGAQVIEKDWLTLVVNFSMIQRIFNFWNVDGAYWSLLPEFAFYVCMGIVILFNRVSSITSISFGWLALVYVNLIMLVPRKIEWILILDYGMYFIAGIQFYYLFNKQEAMFRHVLILLCYLAAIIYYQAIPETIILSFIFALFYGFTYGKLNFLAIKPLPYIGVISYPLYLVHQNNGYVVMNILERNGIDSPILLLLIPIAISIGIAGLIHSWFEKPVIAYLRSKSSLVYNKIPHPKQQPIS